MLVVKFLNAVPQRIHNKQNHEYRPRSVVRKCAAWHLRWNKISEAVKYFDIDGQK